MMTVLFNLANYFLQAARSSPLHMISVCLVKQAKLDFRITVHGIKGSFLPIIKLLTF